MRTKIEIYYSDFTNSIMLYMPKVESVCWGKNWHDIPFNKKTNKFWHYIGTYNL